MGWLKAKFFHLQFYYYFLADSPAIKEIMRMREIAKMMMGA